jgi:glyoxylase-like metal-dependent hydrolase (beta-lactamase superfamily II)
MEQLKYSKEILPGIYRVTLTSNPHDKGVSEIKIFIIKGKESVHYGRSLMVDTGFNNDECMEKMESALEELHIPSEKLDIFLTHRHHDHCGLAGRFAKKGARLFMNRLEERHPYDCLTYKVSDESVEAQKKVLYSCGIIPEMTPEVWRTFCDVSDRVQRHGQWVFAIWGFPYNDVEPGDVFNYGDYEFEVFPMKGHTYGQMGLKDYKHKIFFTADQLIHELSPIVATTYPDEHLLQGFFDSLRHIKEECSDWTIIPAHREIIEDINGDVDKTVFSYLNKTTDVRDLLKNKGIKLTTREISEKIYRIDHPPINDDEFYLYKMTVTKTYSLLEYLYGIDFVEREMTDGIFYWSLK